MQIKRTVLLADDDKDHIKDLSKIFELENLDMRIAIDTEHAVQLIQNVHPSIIITDIDAKDYQIDTLAEALIKNNRNQQSKLVVFCSEYLEEKEVMAFDLGAYDFLQKPLKKNAFIKRLEKIYLQSNSNFFIEKELLSGDMKLISGENVVIYKSKRIQLQQRTFNLFYLLVSNEGTVFTREELMKKVWSDNEEVSLRSVDVHILKIRKLIATHIIKTIKGIGYRFSA